MWIIVGIVFFKLNSKLFKLHPFRTVRMIYFSCSLLFIGINKQDSNYMSWNEITYSIFTRSILRSLWITFIIAKQQVFCSQEKVRKETKAKQTSSLLGQTQDQQQDQVNVFPLFKTPNLNDTRFDFIRTLFLFA